MLRTNIILRCDSSHDLITVGLILLRCWLMLELWWRETEVKTNPAASAAAALVPPTATEAANSIKIIPSISRNGSGGDAAATHKTNGLLV